MLDLNLLIKTWFFKEKTLNKAEVLFDEWDFDNNLYIIVNWEISVEKYTSKQKKETKNIAKLRKNEIFWEASLNTDEKKEVKIVASKKTKLIYIDAISWLEEFSKKYPNEGLNILKYIIFLSNKRLSESNYLITANYKINKELKDIKQINNKNLFWLLQKLKDIIMVDYIIYAEENPVMKNYITIKYDTRQKWKMLDKIIEISDAKLNILELKNKDYFTNVQKLSLWDKELWNLIFFRKDKDFSDNDKKILLATSTSIAGLIKHKIVLEEESNKNSLSEIY